MFNDLTGVMSMVKMINGGDFAGLYTNVRHGANVNEADEGGYTALLTAIDNGSFAMSDFLIREGADVFKADNQGKNALDHAVERVVTRGNDNDGVEVLKIVVQNIPANVGHNVADVDFKAAELLVGTYHALSDDEINQFMIDAVQRQESQTVDYLVSNGADVNTIDKHGMTALLHAFDGRYFDGVKYLIDHGAHILAGDLHVFQGLLNRTHHDHNHIDEMSEGYINAHVPTLAELEDARHRLASDVSHHDASSATMAHAA